MLTDKQIELRKRAYYEGRYYTAEFDAVCNQAILAIQLQAELDRLKAELTNLANTGITPLDGTWAGGWASAMSHVMEIVDNWTPGKAGDNK